jgi:hypothetical protein
MVLLRDVGQVDTHISPFGDNVNLNIRKVLGLRRTDHRLKIHFGHTRWYSFMMWVNWKLVWVRLVTMLISMQDRYIVLC